MDARSFKDRGVDREPTGIWAPAATEMERRGEASDRGDMNRQAEQANELAATREALDQAIEKESDRVTSPPLDPADARERAREDAAPFTDAIKAHGSVPSIESDGLSWWQRTAGRVIEKARELLRSLALSARDLWREESREPDYNRNREERGFER